MSLRESNENGIEKGHDVDSIDAARKSAGGEVWPVEELEVQQDVVN